MKIYVLGSVLLVFALSMPGNVLAQKEKKKGVVTGAMQLESLLSKTRGKSVALAVNHTAVIGKSHVADSLKSLGIEIKKVFAPEHGFRGTADAGEHIKDGIDGKSGLNVISLYGPNRKPTVEQMKDIDVVIYDMQDVGVRFYTFISTLHYVMEACAENNKKLIVLDRPNPNGDYVDGPVRKPAFKSFVGMHPIPVVHGLTVGELARMINGEGWLEGGKSCDLEIIPVLNWKHKDPYSLPIKPSPNIPNDQAVRLYPSTCFFEGTVLSLGRGTETPFQIVGHPDLKGYPFSFTPVPIEGMDKSPVLKNTLCYGLDLRTIKVKPQVNIGYVIELYKAFPQKEKFFNAYFDKLAGNDELKQQIIQGKTEAEIRASWKKGLDEYMAKRKKYLLYP